MAFTLTYHRSPEVLHLGTEAPRAYFIPGSTEKQALNENRAASDRFLSLCGDWDFRYYATPAEIEEFTAPGFSAAGEKMTVPRSWQTVPGHDTPQYTNQRYPFPADPPLVPEDIPSALYSREIMLTQAFLDNRRQYLNFEGVDSCFYLYINNRFVGYSQVSHSVSEFDVTDYLHLGPNDVKVLVFKWCDGSYLEAQDKIRMSGIFREVYLLSRDKAHISDIFVTQTLTEDFSAATVRVRLETNRKADISCRLLSPDGTLLESADLTMKTAGEWNVSVSSPALWSDETPLLYTLLFTCGGEVIAQRIGLRRFEIRKKVIYINGRKVKARGVNRHDSDPWLGYATPMEHMLEDLYILKRHNVNMIRTSHYPNDPRFLCLCDRLGFYVCDETDYETHGMVHLGDWDYFSREPAWKDSLVDRAARLFERDKNHACVIFWSLGNEAGVGENQRAMSEYIKGRLPEAIIHSEDVSRRMHIQHSDNLPASVAGKDECAWVDVESYMYPSVEQCVRYIKDKKYTKPLFLCEYCHAMGNGPGDLAAYWEAIRSHDEFFGGCVWEFTDHSVAVGDAPYTEPHYIYGGDCGHRIHDGNFCMDGLVYPDRRPHTGFLEYKQILAPFVIEDLAKDGSSFRLRNRLYFKDLSDLSLSYKIESDGVLLRTGYIPSLRVAPQTARRFPVDVKGLKLTGHCYITFTVQQNVATPWAEAGYEVGFCQFPLEAPAKDYPAETKVYRPLQLDTTDRTYTVKGGACVYTVNRATGLIASIQDNGKELLSSPVELAVWRAPTDNDRKVKADWYAQNLHVLQNVCRACSAAYGDDGTVRVEAALSLAPEAYRSVVTAKTVYTFFADGSVRTDMDVTVGAHVVPLPRFGVRFSMPEGTENLRYFGRGPVESYEDKRLASRQGLFRSKVSDHFEHYLRPQENMAHTDTLFCAVTDLSGHGLVCTAEGKSFSFNCAHFTAEQLTETRHDFELFPQKETVVNLDYRMAGIGSNSCGPKLSPEFTLSEKQFRFTFRLTPCNINNVDAFRIAK